MTKANPFTQRAIERAIKAAQSCGLKVIGVKPDGTILTGENSIASGTLSLTPEKKPRDAREKLGV